MTALCLMFGLFCPIHQVVSADLVSLPPVQVQGYHLCVRDRDGEVVQLPWEQSPQSYRINRENFLEQGLTAEELECE